MHPLYQMLSNEGGGGGSRYDQQQLTDRQTDGIDYNMPDFLWKKQLQIFSMKPAIKLRKKTTSKRYCKIDPSQAFKKLKGSLICLYKTLYASSKYEINGPIDI